MNNNKTLFHEEPWEKYDKAVREAMRSQQYDVAEKNELLSMEEVKKTNGIVGDRGVSLDLARIYMAQGRYAEAAEGRTKAFPYGKDQMELYKIFWHYCFLEEIYQAQGKYKDARKAVDWLVQNADQGVKDAEEKLKKVKGPIHNYDRTDLNNANGRKFWTAYPTIGSYYVEIGEYEKAKKYLYAHLERSGSMDQNVAIAKNGLAMAYYYAGDDQAAEELFLGAAGLNENATVGFPTDLCKSLTMLGKIAEHRGKSETALKFYQSAIKRLHGFRTLVYKVEESDVWNQIGRFQIKQGKPEEAAKAYQEVIGLRQATGTATHPNCADAHKGLADVAAYKNELTSATLEATQALAILDKSVVPSHPRCASELVALASIHALAGHPEQAAPLNVRLETILQKPLGPWKEDFLDTTSFYAGLLKKAGKTNEAGRLEQLRAARAKRP